MSEQDGTQASIKLRRNRQTIKQNDSQKTTLQRPESDDLLLWDPYWEEQGQPWRTDPEIEVERQKYLAELYIIIPDYDEGSLPFKDIKLSRADVEWLLATHENNRGPVDWINESQRRRRGLDLMGADLHGQNLRGLPLANCNLRIAHLEGADLCSAHLEGANLSDVHLEGAHLDDAHLEDTNLDNVHLEGAHLDDAHLEGAYLGDANLAGTDLSSTFFDSATNLEYIHLSNDEYDAVFLCDIHWGDVNVAVVDWSTISRLGDENAARGNEPGYGYRRATRAYRQLSVVLRNQGLNEHAARFTYRAQLMQRKVFWNDHKYAKWLGSLFLDLLSGYGYKPLRCFISYLLVILSFATTYFIIGHTAGPVLSPLGSVIFSMTSFHGRGFFPGGIALDDPLTVVAALEAFIGLLIEVTFIATLTQRLFGR